MLESFRRLFALPAIFSEEQMPNATLLNATIIMALLVESFAFALLLNIALPLHQLSRLYFSFATLYPFTWAMWLGLRRGYARTVSIAFPAGLWLLTTILTFSGGGGQTPAYTIFLLVFLLPILLLNMRWTIFFSGLTLATSLVLLIMELQTGLLPPPLDYTPLWTWTVRVAVFTLTGWILVLAMRNRQHALRQANQQSSERRELEEAYQVLVDYSLQGLIIIQDQRIVFANEAMTRIVGYSVPELMSLPSALLMVHPDDQEMVHQRQTARLAGDPTPQRYEFRVIHKDGSIRWIELFVALITFQGRPAIQSAFVDLTDRREIEEAYRVLMNNSLQGLLIYQNNRIVFANQAMADLLGYTIGELLAKEDTANLIHPDDQVWLSQQIRARLAGEDVPLRHEYRHVRKDGGIRWVQVFTTLVKFANKPAIHLTAIDITERKQAENALRENAARLRATFEQGPLGMAIVGLDERIMEVNQHLCRMLGYVPEELKGRFILDFVPVSETEQPAMPVDGSVSELRFEHRMRTREGRIRWMATTASTIRDDNNWPMYGIAMFEDITEQRAIQQALRESEEKFRLISENSPVGVFMVDDNYKFVYANPTYSQIIGYNRHEIIGTDFRAFLPPEYREEVAERYRQRRQGLPVPASYELQVVRKDGQVIWAEQNVTIIRDDAGNLRSLGQIVDITARKQAEEQAINLAVEQEKLELLRQFIGNVSHDLKTPLTTINTSLYLLERASDPHRRAEKITNIKDQTARLDKIIQDLLTISRLEYIPQLEMRPVQIDRIITEIVAQFAAAIEKKYLHMQLTIPVDLPPIMADESELNRALLNLIENAITYTPDNGRIHIALTVLPARMHVVIADSGIGIPDADLPYIFNRFYRANQARSIMSKGSGLGLAIVKKIIDMHDGEISVESVADQGTTFTLLLNLAPEEVTP